MRRQMKNYATQLNYGSKSDTETGSYPMKKYPVSAAALRIGADTVLSDAVKIKGSRTARNVQTIPATT
jgi:hypothetical protein